MEKKKLLLVAISVGVFLVIVISASLLVFSPKAAGGGANRAMSGTVPAGTTVTPSRPIAAGTGAGAGIAASTPEIQPATVDAAEMVRNAGGIQNIQTPPSATARQETNFYINGTAPTETYQIENSEGGAAARVTINVPRPTTAAVPDVSGENRRAPAQNTTPAKPEPAAAKPAPTAKPATPAAKPAPAASKPAPVAAKPAARPRTDYWVQTGAFSAKTNAEGVKETLAAKGIASIIENRTIDGKTIYQVRVGPYTSENEAQYWLALVQAMDGFSDSLIRQSSSVR
jgi:DedD protein